MGTANAPVWLSGPSARGPARFHFVACDPVAVVTGNDPADLKVLQDAWSRHRQAWQPAPACIPIAMGFLGYDLGHALMGLSPHETMVGVGAWPGFEFRFYDAVFVHDERDGGCCIHAVDQAAADRLHARLQASDGVPVEVLDAEMASLSPFVALESDDVYLHRVDRVREFLRAGDVYQVNLARRLASRGWRGQVVPGLSLAVHLDRQAPAPHGLWMAGRQGFLLGNSPERFLSIDPHGTVTTCPIKGTRPRTTVDPDAATLRELTRAEKDRAEHVMIVDLERNDLGRICETGTVRVVENCQAVTLPTVYHLVSTVTGHLRQDVDLTDVLSATFPGGSITGAPKRRAMQIIAELEATPRGPYTGATGWLGAAGDLDLAVAIRTAFCQGEDLVLWVGGGIVIDSDPRQELAETNAKAVAFLRLVGGPLSPVVGASP